MTTNLQEQVYDHGVCLRVDAVPSGGLLRLQEEFKAMKAFGIFNLLALLALGFVVFAFLVEPGGDWITPLCLLVFGGAAFAVVDVIWLIVLAVIRQRRKQSEFSGRHPPDLTLVRYMNKARAARIPHDDIERRLLRSGWSDAEIRQARGMLKSSQTRST